MTSRTDPAHVDAWNAHYKSVFLAHVDGDLSLLECVDMLRHLGFRSDALRIEVQELQKARRAAHGPEMAVVS